MRQKETRDVERRHEELATASEVFWGFPGDGDSIQRGNMSPPNGENVILDEMKVFLNDYETKEEEEHRMMIKEQDRRDEQSRRDREKNEKVNNCSSMEDMSRDESGEPSTTETGNMRKINETDEYIKTSQCMSEKVREFESEIEKESPISPVDHENPESHISAVALTTEGESDPKPCPGNKRRMNQRSPSEIQESYTKKGKSRDKICTVPDENLQ